MKELAPYVLSHRIIIKGEYEIDGFKSADLVKEIIDTVGYYISISNDPSK